MTQYDHFAAGFMYLQLLLYQIKTSVPVGTPVTLNSLKVFSLRDSFLLAKTIAARDQSQSYKPKDDE